MSFSVTIGRVGKDTLRSSIECLALKNSRGTKRRAQQGHGIELESLENTFTGLSGIVAESWCVDGVGTRGFVVVYGDGFLRSESRNFDNGVVNSGGFVTGVVN